MRKVNILTKGFISANSISFLLPLLKNKNKLRDNGIEVNFFRQFHDSILNCDNLIFDSKFFKFSWGRKDLKKTRNFFEFCKKKTNQLVFADLSDSASFIISDALEISDKYFKNQVLKKKKNYLKNFYGRRIFSDYYYKKNKVKDKFPEIYKLPKEGDLNKIFLSWNSCFSNYTLVGSLMLKLYSLIPLNSFLFYPKKKINNTNKFLNLNCRMGLKYSKESIAFQRKKIYQIIKDKSLFKRVSKYRYYSELKHSKFLISPFGYGEINLKDFESFLYGCILLKPNMDHLETWPNFYIKDRTYIDFRWDLKNFKRKIENILSNYNDHVNIAMYGQELYHKYLNSESENNNFCLRFKKLLC